MSICVNNIQYWSPKCLNEVFAFRPWTGPLGYEHLSARTPGSHAERGVSGRRLHLEPDHLGLLAALVDYESEPAVPWACVGGLCRGAEPPGGVALRDVRACGPGKRRLPDSVAERHPFGPAKHVSRGHAPKEDSMEV